MHMERALHEEFGSVVDKMQVERALHEEFGSVVDKMQMERAWHEEFGSVVDIVQSLGAKHLDCLVHLLMIIKNRTDTILDLSQKAERGVLLTKLERTSLAALSKGRMTSQACTKHRVPVCKSVKTFLPVLAQKELCPC